MNVPHLVVIGGGINGAAIARDAARRGLRVSLFEKHDFACGTSRASSKLIHGGLRYLQNLRLGLVRSSLRERNWLLRTYAHNAQWLDFVIPVYENSPFSRWKLSTGLHLYQMLDPSGRKFRYLDASSLLRLHPSLDREKLIGAFVYQDGHCPFPERLVLDNLRDAQAHGATIRNYAKITGLKINRRQVEYLTVRDVLTGSEEEVRPDFVVNVAGPWIDELIHPTVMPRPLSRNVKGSHLVFSREGRPIPQAIYAPARSDGRPFFVIPWLDFILVGTTEVDFNDNPDTVQPSVAEAEYLIHELRAYLPELSWRPDDILFSFSGIRSLMSADGTRPGSISREVVIHDHHRDGTQNLVTLVGGKLTTFRETAERVVDHVVNVQQWKTQMCTTTEPLVEASQAATDRQIPGPAIDRLHGLYGNRFAEVLACAEDRPALLEPLSPHGPDILAQVVYAVKHEWARRLEDVIVRRTGAVWNRNLGRESALKAATIMQDLLGWTDQERENELANLDDVVRRTLLGHLRT